MAESSMSHDTQALLTLEHLEYLYWKAVEDSKVDTVNAILQKMRDCGWGRESKTLLEKTPIHKLMTPSCIDDWETRNPTQEDVNK